LHDGAWRVTANAPGYAQSHPYTFTIPNGGTPIDLILQLPATLSGVVVDPSGRPASRATLYVGIGDPSKPGRYSTNTSSENRSDTDGQFTITNVAPGSVMLSASCPGWSESELTPLEVKSGQVLSGLTLRLRPARESGTTK
jgi:hypothetical protein